MPYATVVPAIRTIPGVEAFDYAFAENSGLAVGDLIRVPFRKRIVPAVVAAISDASPYADKAVALGTPDVLLSLGPTLPKLLEATAQRVFSSRPSVLLSWLRSVPKRFKPPEAKPLDGRQLNIASGGTETRLLVDVRAGASGVIDTARGATGPTLVLSAWKNPATDLAAELGCPVLHSDIPAGAAWKLVSGFITGKTPLLVGTKIAAWLACFADTVIIEEPENDDFKQDELAPRFDSRWLVGACAEFRRDLSVIRISLTPRLEDALDGPPDLTADAIFETLARSGRSGLDGLMGSTLNRIEDALERQQPVVIVHPVRGERARYVCSSCGWFASCPGCSYPLSQHRTSGICRKCGRKSPLPYECPHCHGTDFSRGRPGLEHLTQQLSKIPGNTGIKIINLTQAQEKPFPKESLVVVTDAALLAGAVEDIRRRERLVTAWRRLAAKAQISGSTLITQGKDEVLALCQRVMSAAGLAEERKLELSERQLFGFPPAQTLTKLLVDGDERIAEGIARRLKDSLPETWLIQGPYPVPYRAVTRSARFIIQVVTPATITQETLYQFFDPFKKDAYIDLDPVAFFC